MQKKLSFESELRKYRNLTQSQLRRNQSNSAGQRSSFEDKLLNSVEKKNTESTRTPESEKENHDRITYESSEDSTRGIKQSINWQSPMQNIMKQNKAISQALDKYSKQIHSHRQNKLGNGRRTQSTDIDFYISQSPQHFGRNLSQQNLTPQSNFAEQQIQTKISQKQDKNEKTFERKYNELKAIHKSCQQNYQLQQKTIDGLKEQNLKLKILNKNLLKQLENQKNDKEEISKKMMELVNQKKKANSQSQTSLKESKAFIQNQVEQKLAQKLQQSKQKNEQLQQELQKLKDEINKIKQSNDASGETNLNSSNLAEQIICLRSDLDRSHSQCLRLIRSNMTNNLNNYVKGIAMRQDSLSRNNSLVSSFESKEAFTNLQNQENEENDNLFDVLRQYGMDLQKSPQKLQS